VPANSPEATLFELLVCPDHKKFVELCQRLGFNQTDQLWQLRTVLTLQSDSSEVEKIKAIQIIRELNRTKFDYQRPTAFSAAQQPTDQVKGTDTLKESDYSLDAFIKENTRPNTSICQQLTPYGMAQLKHEELLRLEFSDLEIYLTKVDTSAL